MATHSSILAWRIPRTKEPGGLQSTGSQRVRHDWSDLAHIYSIYIIVCVHTQSLSHVQFLAIPRAIACQAPLSMGDSPGKNTSVGCCAPLQGIIPTQGWNPPLPHLLHCRLTLYPLSNLGSTIYSVCVCVCVCVYNYICSAYIFSIYIYINIYSLENSDQHSVFK